MNFKMLGFTFKPLIAAKLSKQRAGMSQLRNKLVLNLLYLVTPDFAWESSAAGNRRRSNYKKMKLIAKQNITLR